MPDNLPFGDYLGRLRGRAGMFASRTAELDRTYAVSAARSLTHSLTRIIEVEARAERDYRADIAAQSARDKVSSLTCEAMSTHQVLLAWRAIYADGGLRIDTTRYIPGVFVFWSQWSGSTWVARLERKLREGHNSVASSGSPHLAFPPGWTQQTEADREIIRKYGKWVSETEWEPPLLPGHIGTGATQQPKTSQWRRWWQRRRRV